ncbi:MAG: hypothetical protein KDK28_13500, partial [Maritimibacter sp.]|nr:hypothetical protein [Maritimibacter sp.]
MFIQISKYRDMLGGGEVMTRPENIQIETSPPVSDEIRQTTCYMCACRCGINVHMKGEQVVYIEGNR